MTHTLSSFPSPAIALIGLGTNLGDRRAHLQAAVHAIDRLGRILEVSSVYETAPVGLEDQPAFLNAAVQLSTMLTPEALLRALLEIERSQGRDRRQESNGTLPVQGGPRTLDLDLLLYGKKILATPQLILPHPALHQRRFVLAPLVEIAPNTRHPVLDRTLQELLDMLPNAGANRVAAVQCIGPLE